MRREHRLRQLPEELLEHAGHDGGLVRVEVDVRLSRVEGVPQLGHFGGHSRGAVDALLHEPLGLDVVDALAHDDREGHAVVAAVALRREVQRHAEDAVLVVRLEVI